MFRFLKSIFEIDLQENLILQIYLKNNRFLKLS
jgi:hypothetical protein